VVGGLGKGRGSGAFASTVGEEPGRVRKKEKSARERGVDGLRNFWEMSSGGVGRSL
jgi:hypothetical protein